MAQGQYPLHETGQEIQDLLEQAKKITTLETKTNNQINKVPSAPENNIPKFDAEGGLADSGIATNLWVNSQPIYNVAITSTLIIAELLTAVKITEETNVTKTALFYISESSDENKFPRGFIYYIMVKTVDNVPKYFITQFTDVCAVKYTYNVNTKKLVEPDAIGNYYIHSAAYDAEHSTDIGNYGTPSVECTNNAGVAQFAFHNLRGAGATYQYNASTGVLTITADELTNESSS